MVWFRMVHVLLLFWWFCVSFRLGVCSSVASYLFVWFDFIVALIVCTLDCCGFCLRLLLVGFMCSFACLVLGDFCVLCWMFWFGFISG